MRPRSACGVLETMKANASLRRRPSGFSMLELVIVLAIVLLVAAMAVPMGMSAVSNAKLRYAALTFTGLIQDARIEAVKRNSFFKIEPTVLSNGATGYYVDLSLPPTARPGALVTTDPIAPMEQAITLYFGQTGPAPNQAALVAAVNFTPEPAGSRPAFNARGLPCLSASATSPTCPATINGGINMGYLTFISRTAFGATNWKAVAITPSGRVQLWGYNGATWSQQ
ncbi:MAG: prepilin-type N-terminal cleavage/methylation domain-containing protein [Acidobacteriota bacterium]|nr:prepilin-type N-terminal cleavage/methylation domain-containing protein [Acidobacteriota bacterium]